MALWLSICLLPSASAAVRSLRLITLDLDDTLWPTAPVVRAANQALADATGATPEELQDRLTLARRQLTPTPSYSEARVLAIESWLCENAGSTPGRRDEAEAFFELWLQARHASAEQLLFDGAVDAVAQARQQHPEAAIVAVTNGRGDPLAMPSLKNLFDFTISAEHDGIYPERKPAPAPFLAALRKAGVQATPAMWAHVGDDIVNDVQAAKRLGAWSVWLDATGDDSEEGLPASSPDDVAAGSLWFSTMTSEERTARIEEARGAVSSADMKIRTISELPQALSPISRRRGRECPFPLG